MPWTRPRFWPTWLTRLQSDGGWATRLRLRPTCRVPPLPPALPCLWWVFSGERPRGVLPFPLCTTPSPHPTPRLCCSGCSGTEGTQGCRSQGMTTGLRGSTAATGHSLLLPAGPAGGPTDAPSGHDGFMHGHSRPCGNQAIPSSSSAHPRKFPDAEGPERGFLLRSGWSVR